jgi:hypothetical protein
VSPTSPDPKNPSDWEAAEVGQPDVGGVQSAPEQGAAQHFSRPRDIEAITRSATFLAVLAYAVGLVVVNAYLFSLGVADFDLLRPRYIATGLLLMGITLGVTASALFASGNLLIFIFRRGVPFVERVFGLLDALAAALMVSIFLYYSLGRSWTATFVLYALGSAVGYSVLRIVHIARSPSRSFEYSPSSSSLPRWLRRRLKSYKPWEPPLAPKWLSYFSWGGLLIVFSFALIVFFATYILPIVPEQFGGVKPRQAELLVSSEAKALFGELGIPLSEEQSHMTTSLRVLFEGNDYYVVQVPDDDTTTFKLNKSDVVGVRISEQPLMEEPTSPLPGPTSTRADFGTKSCAEGGCTVWGPCPDGPDHPPASHWICTPTTK